MIWNSGLRNMNSKSRRKKATLSSWIIFLCAAALLCQGCTAAVKQTDRQTGAAEKTDEKLSVVTTIFPQYDFVREIAGEEVELKMLLKPGEETHSYEPTPQDMIAIENSRCV